MKKKERIHSCVMWYSHAVHIISVASCDIHVQFTLSALHHVIFTCSSHCHSCVMWYSHAVHIISVYGNSLPMADNEGKNDLVTVYISDLHVCVVLCDLAILYSRKLSREKTFCKFQGLWLYVKVNFWGVHGVRWRHKRAPAKVFSTKSYFPPICESFLLKVFCYTVCNTMWPIRIVPNTMWSTCITIM